MPVLSFPDRDNMTPAETIANAEAAAWLIPGKTYRFTPAAPSSAIPLGGPDVCEPVTLEFSEGWYVGFLKGMHIFRGRPSNDPRPIDDALRECIFPVLITGRGSKIDLAPA